MPMAVGKSGMSVEIVIYVRGSAAGETSGRNRRSVIHAPRVRSRARSLRCAAMRCDASRALQRARDSVVVNARERARKLRPWRDRKRRASTLNGATSDSLMARKMSRRQMPARCISRARHRCANSIVRSTGGKQIPAERGN